MSKQIITNSTKKILNNNNIQVEEIIKNIIYILSPKYNFDETEAYTCVKEKPKRKNTGFEKEKLFVDSFNNNEEYKNNVLMRLNLPKEINYKAISIQDYLEQNKMKLKYDETFWKIKKESGTQERNIKPKTDIIIYDYENNNIYSKISFKYGEGRLTSADAHETKALFYCVKNNMFNLDEETKINIDTFINSIPTQKISIDKPVCELKKTEENEEINIIVEKQKTSNTYFNKITQTENGCLFLKELVKEMMSGKNKFGKDNIACADYYISVNEQTFEVEKVIHIENDSELVNEFSDKIINRNFKNKNVVAFKSSQDSNNKRKCWSRFL
jgi:hypothetical protein